ncbi:MAG TPA: hypothetical protein VKY37_10675 [Brumimicrobium sp.]|nr:hypothetical protein [Brumimicrobium sp.]
MRPEVNEKLNEFIYFIAHQNRAPTEAPGMVLCNTVSKELTWR